MRIVESLENVIRSINDIQSIVVVDGDGVPIVSAGLYFLNDIVSAAH